MAIVTRTPKEQEGYDTVGYPEPEEEESKVSGILGSILGMGSAVGGMVPSLLKGGLQKRQLEQTQAGQGTGAALARQTGSEAASRIVGASTAQPSSGRGGALREGLRAADQAVQTGAQQAAITGAREGLAATEMLRQNEMARRGAFRTLGAGVGQGLSGLAATLASARDQGPGQDATGGPVSSASAGMVDGATGQSVAADPSAQSAMSQDVAQQQAALDDFQQRRQAQMHQDQGPELPAAQGGPGDPVFDQQQANLASIGPALAQPGARGGGGGGEQPAQQPTDTLGPSGSSGVPEAIERASDPKFNMEKAVSAMAAAGMLRDEAIAGYKALYSGDPQQERDAIVMSDPMGGKTEEYIYNEVLNYNPSINQGMEPWEAAKLLQIYGLPVDWARLGIVDLAAAVEEPYQSPHARLAEKATSGAAAAGTKIRNAVSGGGK